MSKIKIDVKLSNVYAYFGSHHADRGRSMDWNEYFRLSVHLQSDYAVDPMRIFLYDDFRKVLYFRVESFHK